MRDVPTQHAIRFVFFTAEEVSQDAPGSLGFRSSPNGAIDRTVMALNFDTVGTPDQGVTVWYRGQGGFDLAQLIAKQNQIYSLGTTVIPSDISNDPEQGYRVQSDERSYNKDGRLAVTSLGGNWKASGYHTLFDRPENVDFGNVYLATRLNLATLLALDVSARF